MHLTLLRDGALYGFSWGWNEEIQQHTREQIVDTIGSYIEYTEKTYSDGLQDTQKNAPSNKHYTEPFNTVNRYVREMTLDVLDFKDMWQYFDPVKYPTPAEVYLSREIYSDAVGTADNSGALNFPQHPKSRSQKWKSGPGTGLMPVRLLTRTTEGQYLRKHYGKKNLMPGVD
ncbi:insecticidal delta-endotoxin Cry8Ea1 family protein [Methanosarcina acetivorans]|uniref:Pesticidal crystal protein domain-containing protein n=1 Tax=Methanosarcina acetivorans (strain ATCC 35395 / DSM 2834 / JCM 12185 / C2A) TaxID=188937 RepID=Q8TMN2_METAC|nr:insecticidal delta-endotoxin Cry8Ea1 family protein [Methanosarcina acetivorans]AAM06002.1 hypothetical protein MA_2621 [Methanosarcina acetivorans C2A]